MSNLVVTSPQRPYTFPDRFKAVSNGEVFVGLVDKTNLEDPANQIQVYVVNEDGSETPVSQPLKINSGGLLVYNGQPAKFVVKQNYSMLVMHRDRQVSYEPNMAFADPEALISVINDGDSQLAGGAIWPVRSQDSAQVGDTGLTNISFVRNVAENIQYLIYGLDGSVAPVSGDITALDFAAKTISINGTGYNLVDRMAVKDKINCKTAGIVSGVDANPLLNNLQLLSENLKKPLDISGISDLTFTGRYLVEGYWEMHGSGRYNEYLRPQSLTRTELGGNDSWIAKRDETVPLTHVLIQDFGIDGSYTLGGNPTLERLVSMFRVRPDGCDDGDITMLRIDFKDPAHECAVFSPKVTGGVPSGGTIDSINMLFCSGDVSSLAGASRSSNMFKTIHGEIDSPGPYGAYPIKNVVSFGNKCRGMRTLSDFKRGTECFSHNKSYVEDMTDVASISVDGVKGGTIGPENRGKQTASAQNTKNFYEIQGEDVEVIGGEWDCNNQQGAVAAVLVTDYAYPAETTGTHNANQSVNVNVRAFTARNVPFHAVRLINTKDCDVRGIKAENCTLDGVSFEYAAGKRDAAGNSVVPKNNSVDGVETNACRFSVSASTENDVNIGENISDENDVYNIQLIGVPNQPYRALFTPEELNINPRAEDYGSGAPLRWSGSATATVSADNPPLGNTIKLILEDTNPAAIQSFGPSTKTAISQNQALYFSVVCKLVTSTKCSILVQEFTSADAFIASNFIPLGATSDFEVRQRKFLVTNATTAYVIVSLVPAGDSGGDASLLGIAEFANFKISTKLT